MIAFSDTLHGDKKPSYDSNVLVVYRGWGVGARGVLALSGTLSVNRKTF